ncbi:De-etiolated protein 1 Det1-domain-containing protein [Thamnocephalis sphaerospora]|uniref:De-etiolated protein 1 Det1-domain-containing protein n=1 Tax=Thamnocephalis sphaerospora TaxID=78915 RepID=A0A4V1IX82_9FUNG|nr:De-etiolated protein 1 Det1-domain-containing protein [Thamnocephalis sphaerospora]|eukprot:RKP10149.1 De-etiolated protein 1 Det1-domain-containing protein [Thamnocephalis sphaerospora]
MYQRERVDKGKAAAMADPLARKPRRSPLSVRHGLGPRLWRREYMMGAPNTHWQRLRSFYLDVCPNNAIFNVTLPQKFILKRFSPEGNLFVAFSPRLRSVLLFDFIGPSPQKEPSAVPDSQHQQDIYPCAPLMFFRQKYEIEAVEREDEKLIRNCCLFMEDTRFMLVATTMCASNLETLQNHHAVTLGAIKNVETYRLHVINTATGKASYTQFFENDHIRFEYHSGISVMGRKVAVTSVYHQQIYIFWLTDSGMLQMDRSVGWHNAADDSLTAMDQAGAERTLREWCATTPPSDVQLPTDLVMRAEMQEREMMLREKMEQEYTENMNEVEQQQRARLLQPAHGGSNAVESKLPAYSSSQASSANGTPGFQPSTSAAARPLSQDQHLLAGLHQRILSYIFRFSMEQKDGHASHANFYHMIPHFSKLVFYKAQFVDENHMIIRLCTPDAVSAKGALDGNPHTFFLVVYNVHSTQVIAIHENTSSAMFHLIEGAFDQARGPIYNFPVQYYSSFSSSLYARELHKKQQYALKEAKNGGYTHAIKHMLSLLPCSPQSFCDSPYMDHSLFSYDEKALLTQERPQKAQDYPVKFFDRRSSQMRFKLYNHSPNRPPATK